MKIKEYLILSHVLEYFEIFDRMKFLYIPVILVYHYYLHYILYIDPMNAEYCYVLNQPAEFDFLVIHHEVVCWFMAKHQW